MGEQIKYSNGMRFNNFIVIDRVNSCLGYISTNVVSCCKICNSAKSNLPLIEFENWITELIKFRTNEIIMSIRHP